MDAYHETPQVTIRIQTDLYSTTDFLRELANAIEDESVDITEFETGIGFAEVDWPNEAYEDD